MSGVFGILDGRRESPVDRLMGDMSRVLAHYAWYTADTWCDETGEVGLGRVGIGTFNRETQPVWDETGSLAVLFRGELYHTHKLRQELEARGYPAQGGDLELVLQLYRAKGETFVNDLEGVFVLAIWDRLHGELIIANDRYGLCPLYYVHQDGKLLFAPEVKALLCHPDLKRDLNMVALAEYMRFQFLLGDKTFFEGIKLLPNASLLRYRPASDSLTVRPYWDFTDLPRLSGVTLEEAAEEAGRLLKAAVSTLTEGDHRFGVYLSGGLDSRVILGMIDRDRVPITTITYGQQHCRDMLYARRLASLVGTDHHAFPFQDGRWVLDFVDRHLELTEGFHSWIHAHGISILDQVRPLMDVNLTGLLGDPINWDDLSLFQARDDEAFTARLFHLLCQQTTWPSMDEGELALLYSPQLAQQMRGLAFESFRSEMSRYDHLAPAPRALSFGCFGPVRRFYQYYTVFHRSHLELRFPFYDYAYFEFIYALPPEMHIHRKLRRQVISKFVPRLASVPYDKDNLPVTDSAVALYASKLVNKGKKLLGQWTGLFPERAVLHSDYEVWLRHELYDWGQELLLGEQTVQRGFWNPNFLRSLWHRHQSGLEVQTIGKLAPIMTYEMMLRRFHDAGGAALSSCGR